MKNELNSNKKKLEEKTEFSDDEVKKIVKNATERNLISLKLNNLKKITNKQAAELSKVRGLELN
ncbi:hypothetical protein IKO50_01830 [bacterium]|nr:hypothetical protein [bacterium]